MPLISVIIPTMNEEKHLPIALDSLKGQAEHEVIVVDKSSKDRTLEISASYGARVFDYQGRLLGARSHGVLQAKGDCIFFLDADQVLKPGILQRCLEMIKDFDMLIIGETSYQPKGFTQRSVRNQRIAIEKAGLQGNYMHMYPRFFRKQVLLDAYALIDADVLYKISALDDSFLFDKLMQVSKKKVGFLPDAVMHHEEEGMLELMRHWYRIGRSSRQFKDVEVKQFFKNDPFWTKTAKAIKGHYFTMAVLKEMSYQMGRRL